MKKLSLFVLQGPDRGRVYDLHPPGGTIGRGADNAVVLSDPTVSRTQLELRLEAGEIRLLSRGGKNPVLVNDREVAAARVRPGDKIAIGTTIFAVGTPADEREPAPGDRPGSTVSFPVAQVDGARIVGIVGQSAALAQAHATIARVAPTDVTVLITGESGTGKELAARAIHYNSPRAGKPFVIVDGAALPASLVDAELFGHERGAFTGAERARAGRFEEAEGGTIFLDEIGELPLESQPKLLRVLEEEKMIRRIGATKQIAVDVRVVAATNRDLERDVREGRFRADLYYRLAVATVHLPPLRERSEDIEDLVRYYCARFSQECGREIEEIPEATLVRLRAHPWPGNIRELRNAVRAALALGEGPVLKADEIPLHAPPPADAPAPGAAAGPTQLALHDEAEERRRVVDALRAARGNKTRAAEILRIGRTTLYEKLRRFGLEGGDRSVSEQS